MGNDGNCSPSKGIVILYTICKFTLWKYGVQEPAIPIFKKIQESLFLYVIFPILKTFSKTITKKLSAGWIQPRAAAHRSRGTERDRTFLRSHRKIVAEPQCPDPRRGPHGPTSH